MNEIIFAGSELQKSVDDIRRRKDKALLDKFLNQSKIALLVQPKSQFWKDAIVYMQGLS